VDAVFEKLCGLLEDELERQQTVCAVCEAQRLAVLENDIKAIQGHSNALESLIRESARAQSERQEALRRLYEALQLSGDPATLSPVVEASPEPWRSRLAYLRDRIHAVVADTRRSVRGNARTIRQSLRLTQALLAAFRPSQTAPGAYSEHGSDTRDAAPAPMLLDSRG
jgi:septal ring factor EnvC (AmiA/AmiB activator)